MSSPRERQQTKWVVFGLAVPITVNVILTALGLFFPLMAEHNALYLLALNEVGFLIPLFISLSFGFAMLRSRLWKIDIIINRTLVYGSLTASLASILATTSGEIVCLRVKRYAAIQTRCLARDASTSLPCAQCTIRIRKYI